MTDHLGPVSWTGIGVTAVGGVGLVGSLGALAGSLATGPRLGDVDEVATLHANDQAFRQIDEFDGIKSPYADDRARALGELSRKGARSGAFDRAFSRMMYPALGLAMAGLGVTMLGMAIDK